MSAAAMRGHAMAETLVVLLALAPFLAGIPLLGKQLDIKQKTYDAARYAVWERTVWSSDGTSNRKSDDDITLEARDRAFGNPLAAMVDVAQLRARGITENDLWRDAQRRRLLDYRDNAAPLNMSYDERAAPTEVGYWLVPDIAYGNGMLGDVRHVLQLDSLKLNSRAFASSKLAIGIRPVLRELASHHRSLGAPSESAAVAGQIVQRASAALLSDSWSVRDEDHFQKRVDDVTVNELVEQIEWPGKPLGMQALGKGKPLLGEGQFGWDPDLRPLTSTLPEPYVDEQ